MGSGSSGHAVGRRRPGLFIRRLVAARAADRKVVCGGRGRRRGLPGFVALRGGKPAGFLTYHRKGRTMDLVSIACRTRRRGIGTALLGALVRLARRQGCRRLRVAVARSNRGALRFYRACGFREPGTVAGGPARIRAKRTGVPAGTEAVLERRLTRRG